jgi:hypothetical protein
MLKLFQKSTKYLISTDNEPRRRSGEHSRYSDLATLMAWQLFDRRGQPRPAINSPS